MIKNNIIYTFLESSESEDIPIKLKDILIEVSDEVKHLPELQVSFYMIKLVQCNFISCRFLCEF